MLESRCTRDSTTFEPGGDRPRTPAAPPRADEALVDEARKRRPARPSARDLWTSGVLAAGFAAGAATIAAALPSNREVSLSAVVLVAALALLSRVELEVGPGFAVPTQLVFVPMLFVLPLPLVPVCVAAGYVLGAVPDYVTGGAHPARFLVLLSNSWFSIGPTLVLAAYAPGSPDWHEAPVYLAALVTQFGLDFVSSSARERIAFGHSPRALVPAFAWVYAVDSFLAPVGLAAAASGSGAFLVFAPLTGLLALLAHDRRVRIDRAVAFDRAYRGALDEAHRDDLTGLPNRRRLLSDLEAALVQADNEHVLIVYDLNGFKYYNDSFGHPAGDALLARLAGKLAAAARPYGSSYRLGGDEFCVLAAVATETVETLLDTTTVALSEDGNGFSVSASFGAVFLPSEATDSSAALQMADRRLYAQKHATRLGRGQPHDVLLEALFERDPELRAHVDGVGKLAAAVGRALGLEVKDVEELVIAAQLHDIGKIAIPDSVLNKPGPLDEAEWALIREHTVIGQRILSAAPVLHGVGRVVRATHERWDGNGYADGLAGDAIPLAARIIAVCDSFAAMTSDRPYRARMTVQEALAELRRCAGTQFDPEIVRVFYDAVTRAEAAVLVVEQAA
jgi:diguanylate cyclase (GGDEF)-like protein